MAALGWIVLLVLTASAALAAVALALRSRPEGRAELAVTSALAFFALIGGPVLVLGYLELLEPARLAFSSLLVDAIVLRATAGRRPLRAHLAECAAAAGALALLPWDGLREAWRARSFVTVGLAFAAGLVALSMVLSYLMPFASWDGFFYHEPIVGYAIQNHGFSLVHLPPNFCVQATNGYPRFCEAVSLWFVIFTDKTLIEFPESLGAGPLILVTYLLARRYNDRVTAMGWGVVLFLVPHIWHLLCTTYIDLRVGFFMITAMAFASRPAFRFADAIWAALAMILVAASKGSWLVWIPPIAAIAAVRLVVGFVRTRPLAVASALLGSGALLALLGYVTFWRNWVAFKDPFWPVTYVIPALNADWHGLVTMQQLVNDPPLPALVAETYDVPSGGWEDIFHRGFGLAIPWVVVPLSAIGFASAAVHLLVELVGRARPKPALGLWLAAAPGLVAFKTSPSLEQPRYNMHLIAAVILGAAWLLRRPRWVRMREGVVAACIVMSIVPFFWIKNAFWANWDEIEEHLTHPFESRAWSARPTFDLLAHARVEELQRGDRVAYTDDLDFVGAAWNFEMSNRVEYVPFDEASSFLSRIGQMDPRWVFVGGSSAARAALESTGRWETVGQVTPAHDTVALRRRRK